MKEPKLIREIMADMAMNPANQTGRILRKCPYIQIELLKQQRISLNDLTDEELDRLVEYSFLDDWIDSQDVMQALHISPRTLQTLRSNGIFAVFAYWKQDLLLAQGHYKNSFRQLHLKQNSQLW